MRHDLMLTFFMFVGGCGWGFELRAALRDDYAAVLKADLKECRSERKKLEDIGEVEP